MIIRRKTVGGKILSDRIPTATERRSVTLAGFIGGLERFCDSDLSGIAELELFGRIPEGVISISADRAAYLLKLMVKLSGEDGSAHITVSATCDTLLIGFRLSYGLPELSDVEEIREVGISAGFDITVSEGAVFAEAKVRREDAALGAISLADFFSTIISVFYY